MARWGRSGIAVVVVLGFLAAGLGVGAAVRNSQAGKSVAVPAAWEQAWDDAHVREGQDVVLAWGDRAGADPTRAAAELRFDPARAVAQLDALYALDVHDLDVVDDDGAIARHKIVVVVDGTWSTGPGALESTVVVPLSGGLGRSERGATGTVVDGIGMLRVDVPALTARGHESATAPVTGDSTLVGGSEFDPSWELARGFAEVVQGFAVLDAPGGFASDEAATFWAASAAYLATVAAPGGIGNPADLVRSPQLHWASPRLGDGSWLLLQYLAERDGEQLLGRMWREAEAGEDPLSTYTRLTGLTQADLNRRVAEYALRTVAWDFTDRSAIAAGVDRLDPVLLADRTTPVEAVEGDPGHYRVLGAFAPSDYGYTVVRLRPDPGVRDIHVRVRGHEVAADAGLSFGFVAMRAGVPRYSPVTESLDQQVQLTLRTGENEAYLVVVGTPTASHRYGSGDAFGDVARYPYEFRVSGATVADDLTDPAELGGHRHANGGGFVDDRATVDPTAYVGPDAVVRGDAQVLGEARVEGRAWVEAGAVVQDQAVVRDVAIVRSGAHLSGTTLVAGDAIAGFTCASGSYTTFDPARWCDGREGPPDVAVAPTPFAATDLLLADLPVPTPTPTPEPTTPAPSPTPSATPTPSSTAGAPPVAQPPVPQPTPTVGGVEPPEPLPASACSATYTVVNHWSSEGQNWFQVEVVVTAGGAGVDGWAVSWALPQGAQVTSAWNARLGTSGSNVTAENMSYNGSLRDGDTATFGFHQTGPGDSGLQVPQVTCARTR
ncbi:DUF6055 domain-containing protein [Cellulomonas xylanilytica]|uniref:CBM2 domain-containing protein n=1 Tax=Cellulomonas xylanilytica TaxID=233583 RepID=A0A510V774_9CELL|nr:DUF6055 domain-containing protein [Cellulomonas xylanilytica]GEK22646.1 hypothetical protein CXY01_31660 [Cellulomonas xylanilytica]